MRTGRSLANRTGRTYGEAMRWVLLAAFLSLVGISTWTGLREQRELGIEIRTGYALPEWGTWHNFVRERLWSAPAEAVVRSPRGCSRLDLAYERRRLHGGRVVGVSPWSTTARDGEAIGLDADGYVGDELELVVRAACRAGPDAGLRGESTARVTIPGADCAQRPLRVLDVRGEARARGETLERGDELRAGEPVDVVRGRIVVGAPECNGLHVLLLPGRTTVGDYDPNGRGREFTARRLVVMRADEHVGAYVEPRLGLEVEPHGRRCERCPISIPATFTVRSDGRRAAIRVFASSVVVTARQAPRVRVRTGEQLFVDCVFRSCRLDGPVLFQPGEPFDLERRMPRRLARTIPGRARPPLARLAPDRARVRVVEAQPALLVVLWRRGLRTRPGADLRVQNGLIVWRREADGWRLAHTRQFLPWINAGVVSADITRDGQEDLLLTEWNGGSGGCGFRRVLADVRNRVRELYRRDICETGISAAGGDLLVELPVGPCPFPEGSAHCYGGVRRERWRWNGRRLVLALVDVRCRYPRLDPERGCQARPS
jgi:hypothetical protein